MKQNLERAHHRFTFCVNQRIDQRKNKNSFNAKRRLHHGFNLRGRQPRKGFFASAQKNSITVLIY
jgi:hypothetical protein